MKTKEILIRLNEHTDTSLCQVAKCMGVTRTEMSRTFLNQSLAGYDRSHEVVVKQINSLGMSGTHCTELNAVTEAMVASPHKKRLTGTEEICANFEQDVALISAGLLHRRRNISCTCVK